MSRDILTPNFDQLHLGHHLLDHHLLDTRGERCGNVDDILIREVNGVIELDAVLCGPGALRDRYEGRITRWLAGLGGADCTVVPAFAVGQIDGHVHLTETAPALGLGKGEERAAQLIGRILGPEAHAAVLGRAREAVEERAEEPIKPDAIRVSAFLGTELFDADGASVGKVNDARFERTGRILNEAAGNAWVLTHLLVGWRGLAERFGIAIGDVGALPVAGLRREAGRIVVHR